MEDPLDIRERGAARDGVRQALDRRLFMQFQAFSGCGDCAAAARALESGGAEAVLYEEIGDPRGIGVLSMSEDPARFTGPLRAVLGGPPFRDMEPKPEYSMLGRTYALGHEPDLEDWLLHRPRRAVLDPAADWAVWYPLRRTGAFSALPAEEQAPILREHGKIGHAFGEAGLARDVRLACHGLDKHDNDFVIGLVGRELHPLSACVQAMRGTRQTSRYIQSMGPFFVGRACWRSPFRPPDR